MVFPALLSAMAFAACSGGEIDDSVSDTPTETGTCWWCVDTASTAQDTGGGGEDDTGQGGKDDTGEDEKVSELLSGSLAASTGLGLLTFDDYDLCAYCSLTIDVESAEGQESCSECSFAYTLQLSESVDIIKDGGGCDPGLALAGTTLLLGHGDDGGLWSSENGAAWASESNDTSQVFGDRWSFSLDVTGN